MPVLATIAAAASQVVIPSGVQATQVLVDLTPGEVTCDGSSLRVVALARPVPAATTLPPGRIIAPFAFSFRIDATGRALGIVPEPRDMSGVYFAPSDLQPALAASRFSPGQPRDRCAIRYTAVVTPVVDAPIERIYRYLALPHDRAFFEDEIAKRARDASPGCFTPRPPAILQRGFPDYDRIPQPRGALSMTVVGYDIDRSGKPVRIRTVASDGNTALDAAGRAAESRSRFAPGVRTGCTTPLYRRQPMPLAAPAPPPLAEYRAAAATCDTERGRWSLPPRMVFPEPFRRRAIEGWAVVSYDVAPWGETGNVKVLASEPAAAFGQQARSIVMAARRPPSDRGATGCVERVVFKLPEEGSSQDILPPPPPPPPIID